MSIVDWAGREVWSRVNDAARDLWTPTKAKKPKKPNPWPICQGCYTRNPPFDYCDLHSRRICNKCCPYGGAHPKPQDGDR